MEQGAHIFKADVTLKNMSEIGCLVLTKHMVPAGTELKVMLHVDDRNLTLKGQVKHAEPQVDSESNSARSARASARYCSS